MTAPHVPIAGAQPPLAPSTEAEMRAILQELHDKFNRRVYGTGSYIKRDMRDRIAAVLATLAQPLADAAGVPVQWGDPRTVGMFIRQLQTVDPEAPIYAAFHTDDQGKRRAMVRGVTLSRERVKGRFIETGDTSVPYAHVVWSHPQADAAEPVARDAQRYRAFFHSGLPITFLGQEHRSKSELDAAIDEQIAAQVPAAKESA